MIQRSYKTQLNPTRAWVAWHQPTPAACRYRIAHTGVGGLATPPLQRGNDIELAAQRQVAGERGDEHGTEGRRHPGRRPSTHTGSTPALAGINSRRDGLSSKTRRGPGWTPGPNSTQGANHGPRDRAQRAG